MGDPKEAVRNYNDILERFQRYGIHYRELHLPNWAEVLLYLLAILTAAIILGFLRGLFGGYFRTRF